jgi:hypothetical protein
MTISRANPPGWGVGDKVTSTQQNQVDINTTYALDKRAGQTDTLESDVEVTGDTTFTGALQIDGATTVDGNIDFNGTVTFDGGGTVSIDAPVTINAGASLDIDRDLEMQNAKNVVLATGNVTVSPARTVTRIIPLRPVLVGQTTSAVLGSAGGPSDTLESPTTAVVTQTYTSLTFASVDTGTSFVKMLMLNITPWVPNGATITSVAIELRGAGAHAALPTVMPAMKVGRSGGVTVVLHSAANPIVDASASTAAYQATHGITATCDQNNVVDKSQYHYWVALFNEGNTNAILGLIIQGLTVTFTVPSIDVAP